MRTKKNDLLMQNYVFIWIAVATGLILLVPLVAMQFSSEVQWDHTDFIVIGTLLFGMGSACVLTARKVRKTSHRIAVGIGFALVVLWLWAELAVGIFTNWGS